MRKKVAVLSFNSVVNDGRILKSADSVSDPGFEVKIFGFEDNHTRNGYCKKRESGVTVDLIPKQFTVGILAFLYNDVSSYFKKNFKIIFFFTLFLFAAVLLFSALYLPFFVVFSGLIALPLFFLFFYLYRNKLYFYYLKVINLLIKITRKKVYDEHRTKAMYDKVIKFEPDIIHAHDLRTIDAAVKLKNKLGCVLIWDAHEIYEETAQIKADSKESISKKISEFQTLVDHFITINESIAKFYAEKYTYLPKALIIKNATLKNIAIEYDNRLHKKAMLPDNQKIILYQGGFARKRGIESIVNSSEFYSDDTTLVLMGWGGIHNELSSMADKINSRRNCVYPKCVIIPPAPQNELAHWTMGAFLGLIPYENHGLNHLYCTPNKLWEYPNAGVPLLCTPMVEMKKIVDEWQIGWLLDSSLQASHIAKIINSIDQASRDSKSINCRIFIENDNWEVYSQKLKSLYKGFL